MSDPSQNTRIEKDSMGEMPVPADALYGASTARAVANFPIANRPLPPAVIHAFGHLKAACAQANKDLGKLPPELADAIIAAADEVAQGKHDAHFPVDVYQTGSGTSTNMNANEVIATLANQKLAEDASASGSRSGSVPGSGSGSQTNPGGKPPSAVHPNDHVNMGQSSNDTFPTAIYIAGATELSSRLRPALNNLSEALSDKAEAWDAIVKVGRTHVMDATPIRMGQVFEGFARQISEADGYVSWSIEELLHNLAIGGTAVGTGINAHPDFAQKVASTLTKRVPISIYGEEPNDEHGFLAQPSPKSNATKDNFVQAHSYLKTLAVALSKVANDIRHLGSGPRCGIGELILPAIQPGSSIMPGKVNPVICESVMQVACRVIGNDATVTMAGMGGVGSIFELNVAMPVMIDAFLESVSLLSNVCNVFVDKLLVGLEVNEERCAELLEQSLMTITALAPEVGYDKCSALAKQAHKEGKTIKQLVGELELMPPERLAELMDYDAMTRPG